MHGPKSSSNRLDGTENRLPRKHVPVLFRWCSMEYAKARYSGHYEQARKHGRFRRYLAACGACGGEYTENTGRSRARRPDQPKLRLGRAVRRFSGSRASLRTADTTIVLAIISIRICGGARPRLASGASCRRRRDRPRGRDPRRSWRGGRQLAARGKASSGALRGALRLALAAAGGRLAGAVVPLLQTCALPSGDSGGSSSGLRLQVLAGERSPYRKRGLRPGEPPALRRIEQVASHPTPSRWRGGTQDG